MSLNKNISNLIDLEGFDIEHETMMVQSRLLSPILQFKEDNNLSQNELAEMSGIKQPLLNSIINLKKNLSMKHIAQLQNAIDSVIAPRLVSRKYLKERYYTDDPMSCGRTSLNAVEISPIKVGEGYLKTMKRDTYVFKKKNSEKVCSHG